ncbi:MAG: hypothetical protein R2831_01885 [Chitinophagaceae bacterium]
MIKKPLIVLSILLSSISIYAQRKIDSTHRKKVIHLVSLQSNALLKQIFNFGNSNIPSSNPYLLNYSLMHVKSKWGFDFGSGYTRSSFFENDGNNKTEKYINDIFLRLGPQKTMRFSKNAFVSIALHGVFEKLYNKTNTETNFSSQVSIVDTKTSTMKYGGGPTLGIRYRLSPRIFVGTEASYYFKLGKNDSWFKSTTIFNGQVFDSVTTTSKNDFSDLSLNLPTVLYLTLRF